MKLGVHEQARYRVLEASDLPSAILCSPAPSSYVEVVIRGCVRWLRSCEGGGHMTTATAPAALGQAGLTGLAGLTCAHDLRSAVVGDGGVVVVGGSARDYRA